MDSLEARCIAKLFILKRRDNLAFGADLAHDKGVSCRMIFRMGTPVIIPCLIMEQLGRKATSRFLSSSNASSSLIRFLVTSSIPWDVRVRQSSRKDWRWSRISRSASTLIVDLFSSAKIASTVLIAWAIFPWPSCPKSSRHVLPFPEMEKEPREVESWKNWRHEMARESDSSHQTSRQRTTWGQRFKTTKAIPSAFRRLELIRKTKSKVTRVRSLPSKAHLSYRRGKS